MSESTSEDDSRVARMASRIQRLERRVDRVEKSLSGDDELEEDVEGVHRSLNGLRREYRDLKDAVEGPVMEYIEEEKGVLEELDARVEDAADIVGDISSNRERIADLEGAVVEMQEELEQAVTAEEVDRMLESVADELAAEDEEIRDRVRKLETRMDLMAERME